jgi:hypothetical protein
MKGAPTVASSTMANVATHVVGRLAVRRRDAATVLFVCTLRMPKRATATTATPATTAQPANEPSSRNHPSALSYLWNAVCG